MKRTTGGSPSCSRNPSAPLCSPSIGTQTMFSSLLEARTRRLASFRPTSKISMSGKSKAQSYPFSRFLITIIIDIDLVPPFGDRSCRSTPSAGSTPLQVEDGCTLSGSLLQGTLLLSQVSQFTESYDGIIVQLPRYLRPRFYDHCCLPWQRCSLYRPSAFTSSSYSRLDL